MSYNKLENISLSVLGNTEEDYIKLAEYYKLLDNSFEPPLSSYVDIDAYAQKLVKNAYVCILQYNSRFAGLFAVYINDKVTQIAYMTSLAVLDEYKGNGFASVLMKEGIHIARENGMSLLKFEVKNGYERALKFHEKMGFIKSNENTGHDDTFFMYKILK